MPKKPKKRKKPKLDPKDWAEWGKWLVEHMEEGPGPPHHHYPTISEVEAAAGMYGKVKSLRGYCYYLVMRQGTEGITSVEVRDLTAIVQPCEKYREDGTLCGCTHQTRGDDRLNLDTRMNELRKMGMVSFKLNLAAPLEESGEASFVSRQSRGSEHSNPHVVVLTGSGFITAQRHWREGGLEWKPEEPIREFFALGGYRGWKSRDQLRRSGTWYVRNPKWPGGGKGAVYPLLEEPCPVGWWDEDEDDEGFDAAEVGV